MQQTVVCRKELRFHLLPPEMKHLDLVVVRQPRAARCKKTECVHGTIRESMITNIGNTPDDRAEELEPLDCKVPFLVDFPKDN